MLEFFKRIHKIFEILKVCLVINVNYFYFGLNVGPISWVGQIL